MLLSPEDSAPPHPATAVTQLEVSCSFLSSAGLKKKGITVGKFVTASDFSLHHGVMLAMLSSINTINRVVASCSSVFKPK